MMFDSWGSFGNANNSGPGPTDVLITNATNVLGHWTAHDLNNGLSHAGPPFNGVGDVPLNAATGSFPKRQSVGPFDDGDYFDLATPSIFEQTGSWSCAIVCTQGNVVATPGVLSNGNGAAGNGIMLQGSGGQGVLSAGGSSAVDGTGIGTNTPGVLFCGFDAGTGTFYVQSNNNAIAPTASGLTSTYSGFNTDLGRLVVYSNFPWDGVIYEVWLSTQVPSHSLFNSIYAEVLANGS